MSPDSLLSYSLGIFLGLSKSTLVPRKDVPYLGFYANSSHETFFMLPDKLSKFPELIRDTLQHRVVSVKTLQCITDKCVSYSLAVPAAQLFTREMYAAISKHHGSFKPIPLQGALRDEIEHWLPLEQWNRPFKWREERHVCVQMTTDACQSGWKAVMTAPLSAEASDYWTQEEQGWDISTREATAIDRALQAFSDHVRDARADVLVDNQAVIHTWRHRGGRSQHLNDAIKKLFFTTIDLNVLLTLTYVPTNENLADHPSRKLSSSDSTLTPVYGTEFRLSSADETAILVI